MGLPRTPKNGEGLSKVSNKNIGIDEGEINKNEKSKVPPSKENTEKDLGKIDDNETCKISNCNQLVLNDQEGVQCDMCDNWFHRTCVNISKEEYKIQKKNESLQWFCGKCLDECFDEVKRTKQELKLSEDQNRKLQKEKLSLQEKVENLNIRVKDMMSENSITIDSVQEEFRRKMSEMEENLKRKNEDSLNMKEHLKIITEENKEILVSNKILKKENEDLMQEKDEMSNGVDKMSSILDRKNEELSNIREQESDIEIEKNELEIDKKRLRLQVIELVNMKTDLEQKLNDAKEELSNLKIQLESRRDYSSNSRNQTNNSNHEQRTYSQITRPRRNEDREAEDLYSRSQNAENPEDVEQYRRRNVDQESNRIYNNVQGKKHKIVIIGDSMIGNIKEVVAMKERGSYNVALRGAGIKQIVIEAEKACEVLKENRTRGTVFLQGGGNSLKFLRPEGTISSIIQSVKKMTSRNEYAAIKVISILPRPRENGRYEEMRLYTNWVLKKELELMKRREGKNVEFIDVDSVMSLESFTRDGIHFNETGNRNIGKVIIQNMKSRYNNYNSERTTRN